MRTRLLQLINNIQQYNQQNRKNIKIVNEKLTIIIRAFLKLIFYIACIKNSMISQVNIDLHTQIEPFMQIGTVYFSQKKANMMYVSALWADNTKSVKLYKIVGNEFVLLHTYLNNNQNIIYDRILEIDNSYIVIYKQADNNIQFFYANSTFVISGYTYPMDKILYSQLNRRVYLMMTSGILYWYPLSTFLTGNFETMAGITNINQKGNIQMSSNERFLALGTTSLSKIFIYDLINSNNLFYFTNRSFANTLHISWKSDNQTLAFIDATNFCIFELQVMQNFQSNRFIDVQGYSLIQHFDYLSSNSLCVITQSLTNHTFYNIIYNLYSSTIAFLSTFESIDKKYISNTFYNSTQMNYMFSYYNSSSAFISSFEQINQTIVTVPPINNMTDNATNNLSNSANLSQLFQHSKLQQNFVILLNYTLNGSIISATNKIPGARRILKPIFLYFSNFDDIMLYNYHQRTYDIVLKQFFMAIRLIQNDKWKLNPLKNLFYQYFNFYATQIQQFLDFKINYTSSRFKHVEGNGSGFLQNTINFWTISLISLCIIYSICRIIFQITSQYKISIFFRQYSFPIIIVFMILQGNLQYFMYLFAFQMKTLFFTSFSHKLISILTFLLNFLLIFCAISLFWMIRYYLKQKLKYLYDNVRSKIYGTWFLCLQFGIRNTIIGFIHFFLVFQNQIYNLVILLTFQLIFVCLNIFAILPLGQNIIKVKSKQWINLMALVLRIILIINMIFSITKNGLNHENQFTQFSIINILIFMLNILLMVISIFIQLIAKILQVKDIIDNKENQIQDELISQTKYFLTKRRTQKLARIIPKYTQNLINISKAQIEILVKINKNNLYTSSKFIKLPNNNKGLNNLPHFPQKDKKSQIQIYKINNAQQYKLNSAQQYDINKDYMEQLKDSYKIEQISQKISKKQPQNKQLNKPFNKQYNKSQSKQQNMFKFKQNNSRLQTQIHQQKQNIINFQKLKAFYSNTQQDKLYINKINQKFVKQLFY